MPSKRLKIGILGAPGTFFLAEPQAARYRDRIVYDRNRPPSRAEIAEILRIPGLTEAGRIASLTGRQRGGGGRDVSPTIAAGRRRPSNPRRPSNRSRTSPKEGADGTRTCRPGRSPSAGHARARGCARRFRAALRPHATAQAPPRPRCGRDPRLQRLDHDVLARSGGALHRTRHRPLRARHSQHAPEARRRHLRNGGEGAQGQAHSPARRLRQRARSCAYHLGLFGTTHRRRNAARRAQCSTTGMETAGAPGARPGTLEKFTAHGARARRSSGCRKHTCARTRWRCASRWRALRAPGRQRRSSRYSSLVATSPRQSVEVREHAITIPARQLQPALGTPEFIRVGKGALARAYLDGAASC